jgi:hypothetical protein
MKVPEVWFWRKNQMEIYFLNLSEEYVRTESSRLLPDLDLGLVGKCLAMTSWREARKRFRAAL